MSDEEYDVELPWISKNTSVRNSDVLSIPPAELLVTQRAQEIECEHEIIKLQAHRETVMLSDPSDSEEQELQAAFMAAISTKVMPNGGVSLSPSSTLLALLKRIMPAYESDIERATPEILETLTDKVCDAVESKRLHSEEEVVLMTAFLCVRGVVGAGRRARRVLYRLLKSNEFNDLSEASFESLSRLLLETRELIFLRNEMTDVLSAALEEKRQSIGTRGKMMSEEEEQSIGKNGDVIREGKELRIGKNGKAMDEEEELRLEENGEKMEEGEELSIWKSVDAIKRLNIGNDKEGIDEGEEQSMGSRRCTTLVLRLLADTISQLLGCDPPQAAAVSGCLCSWACDAVLSRWCSVLAMPAADFVRALGRLLRSCPHPARCRSARARLLQHCVTPTHNTHEQGMLEMLVNARKLQMLIQD